MTGKTILISTVIIILVGAASFYGGTVYEKRSLSKQGLLRDVRAGDNRVSGNGQQRRPGGGGPGFRQGSDNNASGDFVAGEIISKDDPASEQVQNGAGKSITIKTRDGGSKIIFFGGDVLIGKSVQGSYSDLSVGQQVMINGKSNADGTISAQNIQIRPE